MADGDKPKSNYPQSITLIAALGPEGIVSTQCVEGGVDASVFAHYLECTCQALRASKETAKRQIFFFMDNCRYHKHKLIIETCQRYRIHVFFNAPYTPQLNPVEYLFKHLKEELLP